MIGQLLTGRYLILEKLGAGGFSETYLARDKYLPHHPLCVVKCLQLASDNTISVETAERLFEAEARLLERLGRQHGQIPTLFAYCHEDEQVYLVQEYIEGENLGRWLSQGQRLTSESAIALLSELLPVLDYIHSHRIIHRDIKPSNLIRRHRDGKIVLIDFGAGCLLPETTSNPEPNDDLPFAIGTPGYMPDEQQLGMAQVNSDLYALAALVIHLLTGVHPRKFQRDLISGEVNWHGHVHEQSLDPKLIEILDRMLRCNFRDRYQQAADVLADLQALPIVKCSQRQGAMSRWRKSAQQMLIPATAMLVIGVVGGTYLQTNGQQAKFLLNHLGQQFYQPNLHLTKLRDLPVQSGIDRMLIAPNNRILVTAGSDHNLRLWSLPTGSMLKSLSGHHATITALSISRDSKLLVSGSEDGTIRLWDAASGQLLRVLAGHRKPVTAITISPDAHMLVSGSKDGVLHCWDIPTGIRMQTLKLPNAEVTAVSFGATADSLISASSASADSSARQIQVWNLRTGQIRRTFAGHTDAIVGLQVANNNTLMSFGKDRGLMWDLNREELMTVFPEDSANPVTASLNEQNIVTVHDNGSIRVWIPKAGRLVKREVGALDRNLNIALSPDHHYLVSWSSDHRLRVWEMDAVEP